MRVKEERKQAKKEKKQTSASKRGRANRNAGKRAEKGLENLLTSWGYECRRVPLSGALKGLNLVGCLDDKLSGDLRLTVGGKEFKIESKKRADLNTYYRMVEETGPFVIDGFCIVMGEQNFEFLLNGARLSPDTVLPDKRFKRLHDWFDQDGSDIVAMKSNHRQWLFAITLNKAKELAT
ncbi:hypothetical protein [Anaeroselena agilis]|uniref:Holliday junction resolvase n=1 Tax=Anaeroselena agilis TaxID=3063788 RepID=A0ABU3NVP7_9FIRM|nr:hypothetical protein [Selenomonadales bacterium 4137-cl]